MFHGADSPAMNPLQDPSSYEANALNGSSDNHFLNLRAKNAEALAHEPPSSQRGLMSLWLLLGAGVLGAIGRLYVRPFCARTNKKYKE